jgi:hypothetical protein
MFKTRGGSTDRDISLMTKHALVAKVADAGEYHRHLALVSRRDHFFVTN